MNSEISSQTTQSHPPEGIDNSHSRVRKTRSGLSLAKDHAIKQSRSQQAAILKRDEVKPKPFVFVGNLGMNATEKQLEELFSKCGRIHCVEIARTGAWTAERREPTQYATIEFANRSARIKALTMCGHLLQPNRRLKVCMHASELPENDMIVQSHFDKRDAEKADRIKADAKSSIN